MKPAITVKCLTIKTSLKYKRYEFGYQTEAGWETVVYVASATQDFGIHIGKEYLLVLHDIVSGNKLVDKEKKGLGLDLVRADFNPGNNSMVDQIKLKAAELIDLIDLLPDGNRSLSYGNDRLKSIAITRVEEAAMWAVKAATAKIDIK